MYSGENDVWMRFLQVRCLMCFHVVVGFEMLNLLSMVNCKFVWISFLRVLIFSTLLIVGFLFLSDFSFLSLFLSSGWEESGLMFLVGVKVDDFVDCRQLMVSSKMIRSKSLSDMFSFNTIFSRREVTC